MQIHNTASGYGIVAKSLHWLLALLIIGAWAVGSYMVDLSNSDPHKFELFDLHKSTGMVILMLVIIRLAWRLYEPVPGYSYDMSPVVTTGARTVHFLLYVFMFIQPLSGWALSSAAGYNPTLFGLFKFPSLVHKDPALGQFFAMVHDASANILLTLFILHVAGALFHHFILKDNVLRRMSVD